MPTFVVLLRAVNVGKRKLGMEDARKVLEDNAFLDVASHIQTGNFLLTTPMRSPARVEAAVGECLSTAAGFDIVAVARRPEQVAGLVAAVDGIPPALDGAVARYVAFCKEEVASDAAARLAAWEATGERAHVLGRDVVIELGKAFHEAKLGNAEVEKITGGPATTRNLTVVRTLAQKWGT
jgi:uncharacterized protein (DUF1697 family)